MRLTAPPVAGLVLYNNMYVLVQTIQEAAQPIKREVFQLTAHQRRHLGLVNAENVGSHCLAQAALPNDLNNLYGQSSFRQVFLWIGKAQVGKDIVTPLLDGFMVVVLGHGAPGYRNTALLPSRRALRSEIKWQREMLGKNEIPMGNEHKINRRLDCDMHRCPYLMEKIWHRVLLRRIGIDNL